VYVCYDPMLKLTGVIVASRTVVVFQSREEVFFILCVHKILLFCSSAKTTSENSHTHKQDYGTG
jgi:hypothetical protein